MKKILWCRKYNQPCFNCKGNVKETTGGCPYLTIIWKFDTDREELPNISKWRHK